MMEVDWKMWKTFDDCTVDNISYNLPHRMRDQIRKFNSAIIVMEVDENKDTRSVIAQNGELIWKNQFSTENGELEIENK